MSEIQQFRLGDSMAQGQNLAMNNFRLGQAQRQAQSQQGLTSALQAGTPEAMTQYGQQFPQEAAEYQKTQSGLSEQKIKDALLHIDVIDKLMSGVGDEPSYQRALQTMQQAGMDTSQVPPNFDPNFIMQKKQEALGFKGQLEMDLKRLQMQREDEKFSETKRHNRATEENQRRGAEAKAAATPKTSDAERIAAGYALRMEESEKIMSSVPSDEQKPGFGESIAGALPLVGKMSANAARSDDRQKYRQAQEDWVRSKLRKESGAVIADEEMDREIRVYFPQIGDSDAVVDQKEQARKVAMEAMKQAAGGAYGRSEAPKPTRKIVRTGTLNGKKVVQYDDGTTEYAP